MCVCTCVCVCVCESLVSRQHTTSNKVRVTALILTFWITSVIPERTELAVCINVVCTSSIHFIEFIRYSWRPCEWQLFNQFSCSDRLIAVLLSLTSSFWIFLVNSRTARRRDDVSQLVGGQMSLSVDWTSARRRWTTEVVMWSWPASGCLSSMFPQCFSLSDRAGGSPSR